MYHKSIAVQIRCKIAKLHSLTLALSPPGEGTRTLLPRWEKGKDDGDSLSFLFPLLKSAYFGVYFVTVKLGASNRGWGITNPDVSNFVATTHE